MLVSDICDADLVTQAYGCTDYAQEWVRPECEGGHFHAGMDLGYSDGGNAHLGESIRSPRNGTVIAIGPLCPSDGQQYLGPYAPCIRTDAEGVIVELGHVQAVHVAVGDRVKAGQIIADLGSQGASSAGHLHLEVRTDEPIQGPPWSPVSDPAHWLRYLPEEIEMPLSHEVAMSIVQLTYWARLGRGVNTEPEATQWSDQIGPNGENMWAVIQAIAASPEGQAYGTPATRLAALEARPQGTADGPHSHPIPAGETGSN
jgi:hypothetical protein